MDALSIEQTADRIEAQIERLRRARPGLDGRITRAEHIIVTQLSVSNGHRPIKVRVHADGSHEYRVRSGSKLRREYTVEPDGFVCTCPWAANGGTGCKHSISCWVLDRALRRARREEATPVVKPRVECAGCGSLRVPRAEMEEVHAEHESLAFCVGDALCARCALAHGVL